ncbi:MAG: LON peptidase substrate-binding domain-containing protein, partial [Bacteroidales bacterium]|nr:LON peptidase substrate-binding domain-containing protein [Bacteroidales bacterium]
MKIPKILLEQLENSEVSIVPVMSIDGNANLEDVDLPQTLPILALRDAVLFPGAIMPITVGREKSLKLIKSAQKGTNIIGTVTQLDPKVEDPVVADLYRIGTTGRILKMLEMPDGSYTAILQGIKRFSLNDIIATDPYLIGSVSYIDEIPLGADEEKTAKMLASSIKDSALYILKMTPHLPQESAFAIKNIDSINFLVSMVAQNLENELTPEKMDILCEDKIIDRGLKLLEVLNKQIEILKLKQDIQQKVKSELDQQRREYYLNNQLKTIQEELGTNGNGEDIADLKQR